MEEGRKYRCAGWVGWRACVRVSRGQCLPDHRCCLGGAAAGALMPAAALCLAARSVITKAYLAEGKDGYEALCGALLLCDSDSTPLLPTVLAHHFLMLRTANTYVRLQLLPCRAC